MACYSLTLCALFLWGSATPPAPMLCNCRLNNNRQFAWGHADCSADTDRQPQTHRQHCQQEFNWKTLKLKWRQWSNQESHLEVTDFGTIPVPSAAASAIHCSLVLDAKRREREQLSAVARIRCPHLVLPSLSLSVCVSLLNDASNGPFGSPFASLTFRKAAAASAVRPWAATSTAVTPFHGQVPNQELSSSVACQGGVMGRRWRRRNRRRKEARKAKQAESLAGAVATGPQVCSQQFGPAAASNRGYPDTSPEVITFLRWLKGNGFRNEHRLSIYQYGPSQGRGVCTRRKAISAGTVLMELPIKCMMLPSTFRETTPALYGHFDIDEDCLIVALLTERSLLEAGRPGAWAPYVALIPRDYGYLPLLEANVLARYATLPIPSSYYRLLNATLIDLDRTRSRVGTIIDSNRLPVRLNTESFNWAYAVVNTRSVHPNPRLFDLAGDQTALVPFFDLFNHAPGGNAQVETDIPDGVFRMITHVPSRRYSQVYINYHETISNREYYLYYGFTQIRPPQGITPCDRDPSILRITPCPQDVIDLPYTKVEEILLTSLDRYPDLDALKDRLSKRLTLLIDLAFIRPHQDVFHLRWPRQLLNHVSLQFTESGLLTFEDGDGLVYECIDLPGLNTNVDSSLEILFTLLSKNKVESVRQTRLNRLLRSAASHLTKSRFGIKKGSRSSAASASPLVASADEEISLACSLKRLLLIGWLKAEYGFDPGTPLTPTLVNGFLEQLGSLEPPLKALFRNELGLLLFHYCQIEKIIGT